MKWIRVRNDIMHTPLGRLTQLVYLYVYLYIEYTVRERAGYKYSEVRAKSVKAQTQGYAGVALICSRVKVESSTALLMAFGAVIKHFINNKHHITFYEALSVLFGIYCVNSLLFSYLLHFRPTN